jgi:glycosyltransferase involved in cell wall biosynthesis
VTPSISVVICAYDEDRWDDLVAAVDSVHGQRVEPHETIVVSDHNPDLLARVRGLDGVIAVPNTQTRGLGGARNSGVAASTGSVVAFLDDDAVASEGWLELFAAAYEDPNIFGVGGSIEPLWSSKRPGWFPDEFDWVVGCTYRGMPESPADVRNLIGCNMSYRRAVLDELGGFRLGYGCDETELCIRIHRRWPRAVLRYLPDARVQHRVPGQRARWRHFRSRCFFEGGSKAVVTSLLGSDDALASERAYVRRALPQGIRRGLSAAVSDGDLAGVARAGAIMAGLSITTAGYVVGRLTVAEAARRRGWTEGENGAIRG